MGFRISNIHAYDRFIAIDLGSYRVRSALYSMSDGILKLDGCANVRQNKRNFQDGAIMDMQGVAATIEKSIHESCKGIESIPNDIIIAFSPAVCIGDSISSQYIRHDSDEPLSMDELDLMIEKIEKTSLLRVKDRAKSEFAIIRDDIRLISSTITSITIDGNSVTHPIGMTGQHVRISVLNIYTLASEYNILRSIISSLGKNVISIVPTPVILPKIVEKSAHENRKALFIDIGYTHMTVVSMIDGEISYFETFSAGAKMLIDILQASFPEYSFTEIESLLMRMKPNEVDNEIRKECASEYFSYVIDALLSIIQKEKDSLKDTVLYVSGGIFSSEWINRLFLNQIEGSVGIHTKIQELSGLVGEKVIPKDFIITHGLSFLGQELLHIKKDPIIRILRYTLYHYE
ncbi:MAG: hypothetical protein HHAS10_05860 [Candidatus Altimarinota bacterium]